MEFLTQKHYNKIKPFLDEVFDKFKSDNEDIVMITHGVLIGIILKFFFNGIWMMIGRK